VNEALPPSEPQLEFTFEFDEHPEKVWKAISVEAFRQQWLPDQNVLEVLHEAHLEQLELLIEEAEPPHERGVVTFSVRANCRGGTIFGVVHRRTMVRAAANDAAPTMLLAA
jgi:hypothetical protein